MLILDALRFKHLRRLLKTSAILALCLAAYATAEVMSRPWTVGWRSAQAVRVQPPTEGEVTLAVVGDVMLDRGVRRAVEREARGDYSYPFRHVRSYLREADLAVANLESPVSQHGEAITKKFTFKAPSRAIAGLADAGFDVVSVANNHILDYGMVAADDTGRLLSEAGIHWGSLVTPDVRQEPVIVTVRGVKVGFLFYAQGNGGGCGFPGFGRVNTGPEGT